MAAFPVLFLMCAALTVECTTEKVSEVLFDITKQVLNLIPPIKSLRHPSERKDSANETETSSALKRLTNIISSRGIENRYNILRSDNSNRSAIVLDRIAETLTPVINPLKEMTARTLKGISKLPIFSNTK